MNTATLIADYSCETGENPLWHPLEQRLYWTDIPTGRLFRYDPSSDRHEQCYEGRPVGGFTVQADGSLLLFMDRGTVALWKNGALTEIVHEVPEERGSRFNDVIADPRGRVFCGTMSTAEQKGKLYRLNLNGKLHPVIDDVGCSNGMAFTLDRRGFYFTDSFAREIYLFDYEPEDGSIRNRRVFARFREADGMPDGITIDADGRLWCAFWDGGCIARLSSEGAVETKIAIPAPKTSSLTFGGEDYSDLYVTTAGGDSKKTDGPLAGGLFCLKNLGRGLPEFLSRIAIPSS
ncbi:D-xylonolactonase [Silvibacterium bohemicum]|uniref:D-xylonolactonase n=1 Tax=Silvibacterium bohemicum TaxID=1577686 RepID=A0A841K287_9BACT|nr:SMP-30/gluconolactonase/LRE family protein [Silvibacterium bohemicum]MBB6144758.1 D-xylonolactonase [Silvibacterium bohemicum]